MANRLSRWVKSMYLRITLTKTTIAFFMFSVVFCFVHALVQSFLFSLDADANTLASAIVSTAGAPQNEFGWLTRQRNGTTHVEVFTLMLCDAIPFEREDDPCVVVFQSNETSSTSSAGISNGLWKRENTSASSNSTQLPSGLSSSNSTGYLVPGIGAFIQPVLDNSSGNISGVELTLNNVNDGETTFLDTQCTRVLIYANQVLENSKREELALVGSEFWLLCISVFAVMYGSIPHLCAALAFRVLSTGWSAYSLWRTQDINWRFRVLLTEGACGIELFPGYFRTRTIVQIPDLALNVLALVLLAYLVTRLVRTYSTFTFQCVGGPDHVVKIYRLALGLFTCLQLLVYLLITSAALWIDQLLTGAIASISSHTTVYLALFVGTLALLLPWLAAGWRAWPFFAALAAAAQLVLLASVALGAACRARFGRGLKEYLRVARALEDADFAPGVFERVGAPPAAAARDGDGDPAPPASPPAYDAHDAAGDGPRGSALLARVTLPPPAVARAQRFSVVLPSLPTLGKNDPWEKAEKAREDEFGSRF
ncbi:hypothetical protein DFH11DRAFT_1877246 [Phellopilus nigrolimitatus]|nr:hypothetical protein DFH11DRAFT_1877246 [Phellopilus nigrolimitatus]